MIANVNVNRVGTGCQGYEMLGIGRENEIERERENERERKKERYSQITKKEKDSDSIGEFQNLIEPVSRLPTPLPMYMRATEATPVSVTQTSPPSGSFRRCSRGSGSGGNGEERHHSTTSTASSASSSAAALSCPTNDTFIRYTSLVKFVHRRTCKYTCSHVNRSPKTFQY